MDIKKLFQANILSTEKAKTIIRSQKDLGFNTQMFMIMALSGTDIGNAKPHLLSVDERIEAFERLDDLSKLIVKCFLKNDDIESAMDELKYNIFQIQNIVEIEKALYSL